MSGTTLKYEKLDLTKAEFRVLEIQPGSEDQQLCCTMRTVAINDNPYMRQSHTSGETRTIL